MAWKHVWRNQYDCGITMPGHSPNALSATGQLQPTMGGVYRNLIVHNVVNRNGLKGEGAGILIAAAGPGSAAYSNTVAGTPRSATTWPGSPSTATRPTRT